MSTDSWVLKPVFACEKIAPFWLLELGTVDYLLSFLLLVVRMLLVANIATKVVDYSTTYYDTVTHRTTHLKNIFSYFEVDGDSRMKLFLDSHCEIMYRFS